VARRCGRGALAGLGRVAGVTLLAGTLATSAGIGVRLVLPATDGWLPVLGTAVLSGTVVAVVFAAVAVLLDRRDVRALLRRRRTGGEG
jgi:putative peptidoglycan lipid II flippase